MMDGWHLSVHTRKGCNRCLISPVMVIACMGILTTGIAMGYKVQNAHVKEGNIQSSPP